jgi:glutamine synthetase
VNTLPPTTASHAQTQALIAACQTQGIDQVRVVWCDMHGMFRGKTLLLDALPGALADGVGMVSTLMLKDTSDRTVVKVFEPGALDLLLHPLQGFGQANNVVLQLDPSSLKALPWAPGSAWLRAQPHMAASSASHQTPSNGASTQPAHSSAPVPLCTRHILQTALAALHDTGFGLRCGLELEFHVYKLVPNPTDDHTDPHHATWPGHAPRMQLVHPGYQLLSDDHTDAAHQVLRIVHNTALAMGLPLQSLEIELGPSQFEAVFAPQDALAAADTCVMFRHAVRQALKRAGYHATFMGLPPFGVTAADQHNDANSINPSSAVMASGWHLHHSLVHLGSGANAFAPKPASQPLHPNDPPTTTPSDARHHLSTLGVHWLAGLLKHAPAMVALAVPTVNGATRFRPNAMAPHAAIWGHDNRGALLRVLGGAAAHTRIENRMAEPCANPYLLMAAHIHAGLDGVRNALLPPPATQSPYDDAARSAAPLPTSLLASLDHLAQSSVLTQGLGPPFCRVYCAAKRLEAQRFATATQTGGAAAAQGWLAAEYLARL